MTQQNYNVIGVMSGTSLDGIDLAHIFFRFEDGKWVYDIEEAATIPYTSDWVKRLKDAITLDDTGLALLNKEYTLLLAGIIRAFISEHEISAIDAVCSHGHTILHQPHNGFTLQIGNLPEIAELTGQEVVCDFRVQDVSLGGQGAPLVPIGDRLLFPGFGYCLNLGGFSNISFDENCNRVAFDICPVNTVLNYYSNMLGMDYDDGGTVAAFGKMNNVLLAELNALPFYDTAYPKSLGFEFVRETVLPLMERYDIPVEDKLHTFTQHIAMQLANAIFQTGKKGAVLVTGGGAYNTFLIELLRGLLPDTEFTVPDDKTVQFKEALIFALLGVLKLREEVNVLASVTGASHDHSSGKIYRP